MAMTRPASSATRLVALFGSPLQQFGWAFATFGLLFCAIFVPAADLSFATFRGARSEADARVVAVEPTSYSVGGGKSSRGAPILRHDYEWTDARGVVRRGSSYATAQGLEAGSTARVEHLVADPERSTLVGQRRAPLPPFVLFVLLFPTIGLALVAMARGVARRQLAAMERGRIVEALVLGSIARRSGRHGTRTTLQLRLPAEGEPHEVRELSTLHATQGTTGSRLFVLAVDDERRDCFLVGDLPCRARIVDGELRVQEPSMAGVLARLA
ncbi:MAG: hypothetical protein RL112_127, partial [Planctomycetota bacterium]